MTGRYFVMSVITVRNDLHRLMRVRCLHLAQLFFFYVLKSRWPCFPESGEAV